MRKESAIMARVGKLSPLKVNAIKRQAKPGYCGDGGGLYLAISKYGTATWVFRYRVNGRLREAGLGSLDTWSLAEARERARKFRQQRDDGLDPIEERRAARTKEKLEAAKAMTFRQCAEAYIKAHEAGWRSATHASQWPKTLETYAYPHFGALPVQAVDIALVMRAIEPIWATKPETASRVRGRIEAVLDWATVRGYRTGENPARWRGHLESLLPKPSKAKEAARAVTRRTEHHAALPYADIAAFMLELRQQKSIAAHALEFAILTAARTGEVLGARWDEIDSANRLWTIPGGRMKAGKEHRVPLSEAAIAIVEKLEARRSGDYIFSARDNRPLNSVALLVLLRQRMGRDDFTVHGMRSTFSDWCAERTAYPAEVREMALAHAVGDKVEAAYRRSDLFEKRRGLMHDWAAFCAQPAPAGDNVRPIRAHA
jgi:integrase